MLVVVLAEKPPYLAFVSAGENRLRIRNFGSRSPLG